MKNLHGRHLLPFLGHLQRKGCPHAWVFCIVPPLGRHAQDIAGAVETRRKEGDTRVLAIDKASLRAGFSDRGPTKLALDGVHPTIYGNALLSAIITAQVSKAVKPLKGEKR
jgi:hypothetical protein